MKEQLTQTTHLSIILNCRAKHKESSIYIFLLAPFTIANGDDDGPGN